MLILLLILLDHTEWALKLIHGRTRWPASRSVGWLGWDAVPQMEGQPSSKSQEQLNPTQTPPNQRPSPITNKQQASNSSLRKKPERRRRNQS